MGEASKALENEENGNKVKDPVTANLWELNYYKTKIWFLDRIKRARAFPDVN